MTDILTIRRIDDWHHHFRVRPTLEMVLGHLVAYCDRAIVMPNLQPAILNGKDITWYRNEFATVQQWLPGSEQFEPLMTIAIQDKTTPEDIVSAHEAGAVAGKIYPLGVTTNSENGLRNFFSDNMLEVYCAMKECDMPILLHGELDGDQVLVTDRENFFIDQVFLPLVEMLPDQRIVFEHMSTKRAVDEIRMMDASKVGGTITAHHLAWTLNDVIGDGCHPHKVCMPTLKSFADRESLLDAATSGEAHFFFGSDNAPHPVTHKECSHGKCGAFTVPHALPMLAEVFDHVGLLNRLEDFTSRFGAEFYDRPLNKGEVTLIKKEWVVPDSYGDMEDKNKQFVPPNANEKLQWQLVE